MLMSRFTTIFLVTAVLAAAVQAQNSDPHRRAFAVSADVGGFPDAFSTHCGEGSDHPGGFGAGVTAIDRPRPSVIVEGELRASWMPDVSGCKANLRVDEVSPGVFESRPGFQPIPGTPGLKLVRTLVRAGLESPGDISPIVRAMVGGGVIWGGHRAPLGSVTVAVMSSNRGTRMFGELEYDISRARETETRNVFRADSTGETALGTNVVERVAHPTWVSLRIGIEASLR
jgi:hypothetical protein